MMLKFVILANLAVAFFNMFGMVVTTAVPAIPAITAKWTDRQFLWSIIGADVCVWLLVFTAGYQP